MYISFFQSTDNIYIIGSYNLYNCSLEASSRSPTPSYLYEHASYICFLPVDSYKASYSTQCKHIQCISDIMHSHMHYYTTSRNMHFSYITRYSQHLPCLLDSELQTEGADHLLSPVSGSNQYLQQHGRLNCKCVDIQTPSTIHAYIYHCDQKMHIILYHIHNYLHV